MAPHFFRQSPCVCFDFRFNGALLTRTKPISIKNSNNNSPPTWLCGGKQGDWLIVLATTTT